MLGTCSRRASALQRRDLHHQGWRRRRHRRYCFRRHIQYRRLCYHEGVHPGLGEGMWLRQSLSTGPACCSSSPPPMAEKTRSRTSDPYRPNARPRVGTCQAHRPRRQAARADRTHHRRFSVGACEHRLRHREGRDRLRLQALKCAQAPSGVRRAGYDPHRGPQR